MAGVRDIRRYFLRLIACLIGMSGLRTCFEMRFGVTDELYDGPPSPSKPVGETNSDGFGEPSYEFQNTF